MAVTNPVLIAISVLITVSAILIVIVYAKSKIFHSYPYYFNIFFMLTIMLNNLIRLIPGRPEENEFDTSIQCYIQGIILTVLDKLMLCQITSYSVIYYLGSFHSEFFERNKMMIFLILSEAGFAISMILATVFSFKGMSVSSQFCYVRTRDNTKYIVDTIVTTLLWLISVLCTLRDSITYHTCRFSFNLVFNILIYLYVDLLINKKLTWMTDWTKDLYYILLSFIGEIFFTINAEVWKEAKRIITCKESIEIDDEESKTFYDNKEMTEK